MRCVGLAFVLILASVQAAEEPVPAAQGLDFETAATIALRENPDIQTVRLQAASQSLRAAQALAPNNPVLSFNKNDNPSLAPFKGGNASNAYQLTWTIGFPGKAFATSASLRHQARASRAQAVAKEIETLSSLANNYAALAINQKMFVFLDSEKEKADELIRVIEKKYVTNQAAQVDLLNAKVVSASLRQDLLTNRNDREVLQTQFLSLLKRPDAKDLRPSIPEDVILPELSSSFEELSALMGKHRSSLKAAAEQVEAAASAQTSANLQAFPDFQLSVQRNNFLLPHASPIDDTVLNDWSVGIGVAIPIFFPFNELNGIRAASRDREAAQSQQESQNLSARAELRTLYTHMLSLAREMRNLTDLVLPAAKSSYELTLLNYSLGKSDYFRLNDARSTWIQAEKNMLLKKLDAAQSFSQLTQIVGCDATHEEGRYACKN